MYDFLYSKKGFGNQQSFCCRMWNNQLASLGNSRPSIFGIYYSGGITLAMSPTFKNMFSDFEPAFKHIKKEIVRLLDAGEKGNLRIIEDSKLNSTFMCLLLATYFKYSYAPAPTITALDAYCKAVGISFNPKNDPIYRNVELVSWMKEVPQMEGWTTYHLMLFCDWLWRNGLSINGSEVKGSAVAARAKKLDEEISQLNLLGETRDAVVRVRVNQGVFRELLLQRYNHCCLCGVKNTSLLNASHIKPWAISEDKEKLDVDNGFLMCPNHDRLFDHCFITFTDEGDTIISEHLADEDRLFTNVRPGMKRFLVFLY